MKRLILFFAVIAIVSFVSAAVRPSDHDPKAKFMKVVCQFGSEYDAAVAAGHMQFQLSQQGYGNFQVYTYWIGDGAGTCCYYLNYTYANANSETPVWYSLKYPPRPGETSESLMARGEKKDMPIVKH